MIYEVPSEDWDIVQSSGDVNRIIDYLYLTCHELTLRLNMNLITVNNLSTTVNQQAEEIEKLEYVLELQKIIIEEYMEEMRGCGCGGQCD